MNKFQDYPKLLHHPQHSPAKWRTLEGKGVGLFTPDTICTSQERYPDVTVSTLDQEQYYAARGYRPNNMANAEQYEQAILESKPVDGYAFSEFPKWKYHAVEFPVVVKSAGEEAALGAGWSDKPVIATEDDIEQEEESPAVNGSHVPHEVIEDKPRKPPVKAKEKPKKTAKSADKVDKRTKAYKQAHA